MKTYRRSSVLSAFIASASCALAAASLFYSSSLEACLLPTGIAPVLVPAGGFRINGLVPANGTGASAGDWLNGPGGNGVLDAAGNPLNPTTTFHFVDPFNSSTDSSFKGGLKWIDNPNTWRWVQAKPASKTDVNNVLFHVGTDANGHTWIVIAADRLTNSGNAYLDFELLQSSLTKNSDGTFTSKGPNGGRTKNDLLLSLDFNEGGSQADFTAWRWQANPSGSGFTYVDATDSLPRGRALIAASPANTSVPFGAFGKTTYGINQFVEAAVDLTALIGDFDPCLSIGVDTILIKTKTSTSDSATISDLVDPIHFTLRIGPNVDAGPAQTQCSQGASTAFALNGIISQGVFPIVSTRWTVVSGTATVASPNSVNTTAQLASGTATLRLTVTQANGCTKYSDVALTVKPAPACSIAGPTTATPGSPTTFTAPAGMTTYAWSVMGNASISGPADGSAVSILPGTACGTDFQLALSVTSNGCPNSCSRTVTITDPIPPTVIAPPDRVLECPADTTTNQTGVALAADNSGNVTVSYQDIVTPGCGGSQTISRLWTATDLCGNSADALQLIQVKDTTPPVIHAPIDRVLGFTDDASPAANGTATASDTCSAVTVSYADTMAFLSDGTQVITRTWTATDACSNHASAVQTITLDSPIAPVLPSAGNIVLADLTPLVITNTASNPNVPANPLTYQLIDPPAGAAIDANGVITWTPTVNQSPSTNIFTTVVTTTVSSSVATSTISATNTFVVIVTSPYDGINLSDPDQALADNDGDTLSNLLEYSVGSDPNNSADASTGLAIWITRDNGSNFLAMKFKRRINATSLGLQYAPEVSADKASWQGDSANIQLLDVSAFDSQFDWVTVRDLTPLTPEQARFMHLRVVSGAIQTVSPTWIGSATPVQGASGATAGLTYFSQRMVLPIQYAGVVSSLQTAGLVDTNATWGNGQFGSLVSPAYAEFDNGTMVDITSSGAQSLSLAGALNGVATPGDVYRVRQHFTIASLFGTNNETGLKPGLNPSQADTILLQIPETGATMTIFYFSNAVVHGWYRSDYSSAANQIIYPEQGVMVRRVAAGNVNVYACGPVKTGVTVAPVEPGYNLVGTLKSLSSVSLSQMNLYTGSPLTGLASGLNPSTADTLVVVQPNGSTATYFYFKNATMQGWYSALFQPAGNTMFAPGSAFFIQRRAANGPFNWTIPAE
jgi:hypothetical protein